MVFSWEKIQKPVFILAPMANITTLPFRSICKEMGADIVYTPMLSSNAIVYNPYETYKIAEFLPNEQPVIVQIFGYDGNIIAKAAKMVDKQLHPAGIDINMGCPAPKITGNECGSALLKDYDKALDTVKIIRQNYDGQLSVKVRLGWDDYDILPFIKKLESIGINAVSIHGRTAKQGYKGKADWDAIEEIAKNVNIPVIGNGDITDQKTAWDKLSKSHLSGIMIGRSALGNPWIFRSIIEKKDYAPTTDEILATIQKQATLAISTLGEDTAMRELRKHLGWYIQGFPKAKIIRREAMQIKNLSDLKNVLKKFPNNLF